MLKSKLLVGPNPEAMDVDQDIASDTTVSLFHGYKNKKLRVRALNNLEWVGTVFTLASTR